MRLTVLLLALSASVNGDNGDDEQKQQLSQRDEALIEYTFQAIAYARARDDLRDSIGQVTGEELEEMGLTRYEFEQFTASIYAAMDTDTFRAHVEIDDYLTALSNLVVQLNPRGFKLVKDQKQPEFDEGEASHEELREIEARLVKTEKPRKKGPFFATIDHLQANTFIDDDECPSTWSYNGKEVTGCQTDLRTDGRLWCSLDDVFTGNFIFCEQEEEKVEDPVEREQAEKARQLHFTAKRGLIDNLRDEKYAVFRDQLTEAIELGSKEAMVTYYQHRIFGYMLEQDFEEAIIGLVDLAKEGIPSAQGMLGILQASGLGVDASQAKAMLNFHFGSFGNDLPARLALANRYHNGLGLPKSCSEAMRHYRFVAARIAEEAKLMTHAPWVVQTRIIDEEQKESDVLDDDEFNYFSYLSETGGVSYQVRLAQLLLQRGFDDDVAKAAELFQMASNAGDPKGAAFLGKMYLEGLGVTASNETAFQLFKKSADQGDPIGQAGMGIMYMEGRSIGANPKTAVKYFQASADQGHTEGQLRLGMAYMSGLGGVKKDTHQALKYLRQASKEYHSGFGNVLAFWYMGEIYAPLSCADATRYYKFVAELGPWNRLFTHAWKQWKNDKKESALAIYTYLAELGYEKAQSNIATILDDYQLRNEQLNVNRHKRAFFNWKRAADQSFPMARIRVGDHHWYGLGVPLDYTNAADHYRLASHNTDAKAAAQALFNLGYMHHFGFGVPQDYHLSKRFYDAAAEKSIEAHLPSTLALMGLACSYIGDTINENGLMLAIALGNAAVIALLSTLYIIRDHFR